MIELALSLANTVAGPSFGVFIMGFMLPFVDEVAALCGLLSGFGTCVFLYTGRLFAETPSEIVAKNVPYPKVTTGCLYTNGTSFVPVSTSQKVYTESGLLSSFYNVSYHYVGFIGLISCLVTGKSLNRIVEARK